MYEVYTEFPIHKVPSVLGLYNNNILQFLSLFPFLEVCAILVTLEHYRSFLTLCIVSPRHDTSLIDHTSPLFVSQPWVILGWKEKEFIII